MRVERLAGGEWGVFTPWQDQYSPEPRPIAMFNCEADAELFVAAKQADADCGSQEIVLLQRDTKGIRLLYKKPVTAQP